MSHHATRIFQGDEVSEKVQCTFNTND